IDMDKQYLREKLDAMRQNFVESTDHERAVGVLDQAHMSKKMLKISIITIFIQEPIPHIGTSLIGVIIIYSLGNMLWLFGIHQAVIYSAILEPLLLINITENITAANNGQAIPHI
ncbi:hypothetical protein K8353_44945, partial [Burkholderia contaminans]|nr:hypothetical protein [Burkholderia contaminans]